MKWVRVALFAGVAVAIVAGEVQVAGAVFSARDEARRARQELQTTKGAVDQTKATTHDRRAALTSTKASSTARAAEAKKAQAALKLDQAALDALNKRLAAAKFTVATGNNQLTVLRNCNDGVGAAMKAVLAKNVTAANAALADALASCATVLAAAGQDPPVFPFDFADPFVQRVGDVYYAYSTNAAGGNVQVLASFDLAHWRVVRDALPQVASWAVPGATWAPEVLPRSGGRYVMYYTVREAASFDQCISVATSPSPSGPFVDYSTGPLVCQRELGGSIDPSPFVDGFGGVWLTWKSEHSPGSQASAIWSQPMNPDGLTFNGPASIVLQPSQRWEDGVVEAPTFVQANGTLMLLYAGNHWDTTNYATGEAVCATPAGPCTKPHDAPVLVSSGSIAGPGGASFFTSPTGQLWISYAAYTSTRVGYPASRFLHLSGVQLSSHGMQLTGR